MSHENSGLLPETGKCCSVGNWQIKRIVLGSIINPVVETTMSSQATSLSLLARIRSGEDIAWNRLVDLYAPLVQYWCRKSHLSEEDTADIMQEVFRVVVERIEQFRKDQPQDSFRGWLRVITANKIRDHLRRQTDKAQARGGSTAHLHLHNVADPIVTDGSDEIPVLQQAVLKTLEWIREDFEEKTFQAFWKCQIEEVSTEVVSAELGMTPAAVRKAKYRVLRRLREELDGLVDEFSGE